jgi:hypothetical protein
MYLTVTYPSLKRDGSTFTYARFDRTGGANAEIEKRSLQVVANETVGDDLQPVSLEVDESLPLPARLIGVWEVIAAMPYGNSRRDLPPYGFLNDLWVFDAQHLQLDLRVNNTTAISSWSVSSNTLTISKDKGHPTQLSFSFDRWGHLFVDTGEMKFELKHLTADGSRIPKVPLKVVLLEK